MTPRKAVDEELSRKKILQAARAVFVEKGYQHASMRLIANRLQYSHGAIYYHFKNKAELFYALVAEDFTLLNQTLDQIMAKQKDSNEKLRDVLLGYIRFGLNNPNHYEIMFLVRDPELQQFMQKEPNESYQKFAEAILALAGFIEPKKIWSVFLSLHGFVTHYCGHGLGFQEVEMMAEAHVDFLLEAMELSRK